MSAIAAPTPPPVRSATRQRASPAAEAIVVVEYGRRRALIVCGVMLAALLQTLDATIVNVALPTIEGNIGASIDDGTWIITGYIISNVIAIPLAPFLLMRLGRRQYYATCIIGFTVASFLCGTADSLGTLVFYRIVQGTFGGGLIATSQIILRDTFPQKAIGASSALFAIALTVGPALGPTLGGILTDAYSWQWVFDINLVPGTIAAIIILTSLRNPLPPQRLPFDGVGVGLLALGLGSLQYVLDEGERHDWFDDGRIVAFAITAVAGLIAFALWELYGTKKPIVDLRVFRYRNVRFGVPAALVLGMIIFGPVVILPQYVQTVLGFTATLSGLLILMRALPVMLLTPFVARFATRLDPRIILTTGFCLSALSFVLLSSHMTTESDFDALTAVLVVSGIGQALLLVPLLIAIIGSVAPQDSPKASSFVSLSVQLGGSIASTVLVTAFDRRTFFHSDIFRGMATLQNHAVTAILARPSGRILLSRIVALQATNAGFADTISLLVPLAFAALIPVWLLRVSSRAPSAPVQVAE
ncbi:MAG: DHA2 family efflux MFS transporter permease subunit [Candidatus Eremiobacteraeota bacterium]|nr:DHA2 family efflux MFS transporter permease subunit [Candidatus Eremiobacteraeota bacterium]